MVNELRPRMDVESEMDPTGGPRAFNQWLQVQLRARKLTQRQLAQKSGVDHSTISRLVRGDRIPSLRTVTLLARSLGMPHEHGSLDDQGFGRSDSFAGRVEYALRSDDQLSEADVRRIMDVYFAARLQRLRRVATLVPAGATSSAPVPIIIEVAGLRPSSSIGRLRRQPAKAPATTAEAPSGHRR
jgi:transcriptional regulator with XRE-family HTH domain